VFGYVHPMLIRIPTERIHRSRRLARRFSKDPHAPRYTGGMTDLFSVPAGTVPQEDAEYAESGPQFPPEVFAKHQGKWVALRGFELLAVRDTRQQLREEFGLHHPGITFFDVPKDSDILIL